MTPCCCRVLAVFRRRVYEILEENGVDVPKHVVLERREDTGDGEGEREVVGRVRRMCGCKDGDVVSHLKD